jgi:hypothetical protein
VVGGDKDVAMRTVLSLYTAVIAAGLVVAVLVALIAS